MPESDSGRQSLGNLGSFVPAEKMINMNTKPGLKKWGQTLPVHNQQRFHSMLALWFPFGKLAIYDGPCRRYVMERRDQGLDRGPWRVAEYYIRCLLVSPSWVPLPGCIWIGHIFPESRRPRSVREADRVRGFAAVCKSPRSLCWLEHQEVLVSERQETRCLNLCWPSAATKAICWNVYFKLKWTGNILNESSCLFQFLFLNSGAKHIEFSERRRRNTLHKTANV